VAILRLLVPAVSAAARAINQFVDHAESLARTIDSLGIAVAVYDTSGCLVHQTPRLTALLAGEPDRAGVLDAARNTALSLISVPELRTAKSRYRIDAILGGAALSQTGRRVIVTIPALDAKHGETQLVNARATLAQRLDLTPREQEVSLLIAEGLGIQAITAKLGVSRHTVRHHVERVFQKLDVHTHSAACARIRSILEGQTGMPSGGKLQLAAVSGARSAPVRREGRARVEA
jgi:DNA-binding CsgD family transcriptional regulator